MKRITLPLTTTAITVEGLGRCFPLGGLDDLSARLLARVCSSWVAYPGAGDPHKFRITSRNACVFLAGGASGIGKTRLAGALPGMLLAAAEARSDTPPDLVCALRECYDRQLVLQVNMNKDPRSELGTLLIEAYCEPPCTASDDGFDRNGGAFQFFQTARSEMRRLPPRGAGEPSVEEALHAIAACERRFRPTSGPIPVVVHLDEVQVLAGSSLFRDAEAAGRYLGALVREMAEACWRSVRANLFPIFYISGLSKTLVLLTKSSHSETVITLPVLNARHYVTILRGLLGLGEGWEPSRALARASALPGRTAATPAAVPLGVAGGFA
jgi:hypothetical protein